MLKWIKNKFLFLWSKIKPQENHWIQAKLIGLFWFDPTKDFTKKGVTNPRFRIVKYIDIAKDLNVPPLGYNPEVQAQNIMKYEKNIMWTFAETLFGVKTAEEKGIAALLASETKNTLNAEEGDNLKLYTVLHFARSKQKFNLIKENVSNIFWQKILFNIDFCLRKKEKVQSLKDHNPFVLELTQAQNLFLADNIIMRMEEEECVALKQYFLDERERFLKHLKKHSCKMVNEARLLGFEKELQHLCIELKDCPCALAGLIAADSTNEKNIDLIFDNFISHIRSSVFFIYHPKKIIYLTPQSVFPEDSQLFIHFFMNFLLKQLLSISEQYIVIKEEGNRQQILAFLKESKKKR